MSKKIKITIVAFIAVLAVGAFWFYREKIFSKEILRMEILAPETAKVGQEVEYTVKYKNNGNFVLEKPKLIFELPQYSLNEEGKTRFTAQLEDIYPGQQNSMKFKGVLLGKEGDIREARAWLSYVPKNLSARYESSTTFATKIESVPITLDFDLVTKAEKSKEITYSVNYFSNVEYPLESASIKIEPVNGFNFISSDPLSLDNAEWKLKTLNKSQGGRITVNGTVIAEAESQLSFYAKLGVWQNGNFVVLKEAKKDVQVIQPLLFVSQKVNGFSDYVASPGETLRYEVFFRNIGTSSFDDLFVIYRLDNRAFDLTTLYSQDGQVRPNDNLLVFDYNRVPSLRRIDANQEVSVAFSVKLKDNWAFLPEEQNSMTVKNKVNVLDISQEFITKVNSSLQLLQKAYRQNRSGIENSGPIPPKVGEATTYVVTWQVQNYFNEVRNIKVKALLPQNVFLYDAIWPESEASHFSFDNKSREIVWTAGNLQPNSSTSVEFQIVFTPAGFQKGSLADLIFQATVSGEDQFTGATVYDTAPKVNTSLPDDKDNSGGGIVQ